MCGIFKPNLGVQILQALCSPQLASVGGRGAGAGSRAGDPRTGRGAEPDLERPKLRHFVHFRGGDRASNVVHETPEGELPIVLQEHL